MSWASRSLERWSGNISHTNNQLNWFAAPWGKRSWKTFYAMLKGMVLYLQKVCCLILMLDISKIYIKAYGQPEWRHTCCLQQHLYIYKVVTVEPCLCLSRMIMWRTAWAQRKWSAFIMHWQSELWITPNALTCFACRRPTGESSSSRLSEFVCKFSLNPNHLTVLSKWLSRVLQIHGADELLDRPDQPGVCTVLLASVSCCCRLSEKVLSAHPARYAVQPPAGNSLSDLLHCLKITKPIGQQVWVDMIDYNLNNLSIMDNIPEYTFTPRTKTMTITILASVHTKGQWYLSVVRHQLPCSLISLFSLEVI